MKKLHFWDRILLFLCALTALLCGLYLIYESLPKLPFSILKGTFVERLPMPGPFIPIGAGLLSVLLSLFLFLLPRRLFTRRKDFVVQKTDNGELRISVKAIENLVKKCVSMHEEARLQHMSIRTTSAGIVINLHVSLANNISIPLAVASMQKQIKQYLLASSGITVREVRVSVETAMELSEASPYAVPAETGEKDAEPKEKKRPAHQRLFSRPDEPAVMPTAPTPEEKPETPEPEMNEPAEAAEAPEAETETIAEPEPETEESETETGSTEAEPETETEAEPEAEEEETHE